MKIKKNIESIAPTLILDCYRKFKFKYGSRKPSVFYSQEGEDIVLKRILQNKECGFYIDIGAHHPYRYSNTYLLYKKGWRGMNVDASPLSIELFEKARPNDINLNFAVSENLEKLNYYIFEDGAYNTLSSEMSVSYQQNLGVSLKSVKEVITQRLDNIFNKYLPKSIVDIDLMTIDVEGLDLGVLKSNNWEKYSPNILVVEEQWSSIENILNGELYGFLVNKNYVLYSKLVNSLIFIKSDYLSTFNE